MKYFVTAFIFVSSLAYADGDLATVTEKYYKAVHQRSLSDANCSSFIKDMRKELVEESAQMLPDSFVMANGTLLSEKLWQIRLKLHDQLASVKSCKEDIQKAFVQIRYIEDLLALKMSKTKRIQPDDVKFFNEVPAFMTNERFHNYHFKPGIDFSSFRRKNGDLMVTRGITFFSAALTRIPNLDGQFSHFVLVNIDEKTGKETTIESYAQTGGVSIFDMKYALQNENARILVLRPHDAEVARNASNLIVEQVEELKKEGKQIPYDYDMNIDDPSAMTCAEVAHWAYRWASNDQFDIPENKSTVSPGLKKFTQDAGISEGKILTPKDIEVDSRFDVIAEYKDLRILRDMIYKDVILTKIYDWMIQEKYELNYGLKSLFAAGVVFPLRHTPLWPLMTKLGMPDFAEGTPFKFFSTFNKLTEIGGVLYKQLEDIDKTFEKRNGWPMTTTQLKAALEDLRKKDLEKYIDGTQAESMAAWHNMLRNPNQWPKMRSEGP